MGTQAKASTPRSRPATRVVQIEMKSPLWPIPRRSKAESEFRFASHAGGGLAPMHLIFQKHKLLYAFPSFRRKHPRQKRRRSQGEKDELNRFVDLHFPANADGETIVRELRTFQGVAHAIQLRGYRPATLPTDPLLGMTDQDSSDPATGLKLQWYIFRCGIHRAWEKAAGKGVVIADVDAGYYLNHADLENQVDRRHTHNAWDGSTDVISLGDTAHGTGVLGLAAGASNVGGIAGVAYAAKCWAIQTDAGKGPAPQHDLVATAIDWIRGEDAGGQRVVILVEQQTLQGGNIEQSPAVRNAIQTAIAAGYVVCVAAGNGLIPEEQEDAPGATGGVDAAIAEDGTPIPDTGSILVGATAYDDASNPRAAWGREGSNWGSRITVSAPGDPVNDVTCRDQGERDYTSSFGGTSGAAAKVAGVIALMLEANPKLTHDQVKQILADTGTELHCDKPMGVFLNADGAVTRAWQLNPSNS